MSNKNDARYQQTEQKIETAFIGLLQSKGFDQITMKELIAASAINKSTFYAHYEDKYDLFSRMEDRLLDGLFGTSETSGLFNELPDAASSQSYETHFLLLAEYVLSNQKLFSILMAEESHTRLLIKLVSRARELWRMWDIERSARIPSDYVIIGSASLAAGIVQQWVQGGFRESPEEFARILQTMAAGIRHAAIIETTGTKR